jgi:hypothetical protein
MSDMKWATLDTFLGVKRSGREADLFSVSYVERKNEWNYFSIPPLSFYGLCRNDFTFTCHIVIS